VNLLYFAWVRQIIGTGEEQMALPQGVHDVRGLIANMKGRDEKYARAFAEEGCIRVAVNQRHAGLDAALADDDEVAFFPPVTGG
jgi:molybdopterin synthase sulfur carrier subunit